MGKMVSLPVAILDSQKIFWMKSERLASIFCTGKYYLVDWMFTPMSKMT